MTALPPDRLERLARQRAGAKLGWIIHACVYVVVNLFLAALAITTTGHHWYIFPLLGWGLGLALHGVAVWLVGPGATLRERMVERERSALRQRL